MDERLWLDLIDAVVQVTRNVSDVLEAPLPSADESESEKSHPMDSSKLLVSLRTIVQETFTALLTSTSIPNASSPRRDMSFLRILRAFLNRASLSSPSLANLRAVLAAIFSAYSYEESLLALANRLLDKDLFVHVAEVTSRRKRGWRPLGQVCVGCGKRVWGPGAGAGIWEAWQTTQALEDANYIKKATGEIGVKAGDGDGNGKGKAVIGKESADVAAQDAQAATAGGHPGPMVIFSCRHVFHRKCLEDMQTEQSAGQGVDHESDGPRELVCPLPCICSAT